MKHGMTAIRITSIGGERSSTPDIPIRISSVAPETTHHTFVSTAAEFMADSNTPHDGCLRVQIDEHHAHIQSGRASMSGVPAWNFRPRSELLLRFLTLLNSAQTSGAE
jgi:hypothetical protein